MIYFIIFLVSLILLYFGNFYLKRNNKIGFHIFSFFALLPPLLLASFRDVEIGTDTKFYVERLFYEASRSNFKDFFYEYSIYYEPLYLVMTYAISICTNNIVWLFLFIQFIIIGLVYLSALKIQHYVSIVFPIFIYFFAFYNIGFNYVRQMLAMSLCLYSFSLLQERKTIKSLIIFFPAIGFHYSSIVYILVYAIFYFKYNHPNFLRLYKISIIIFSISAIFFTSQVIYTLISLNIFSYKLNFYSNSLLESGTSIPLSLITHNIILLTLAMYSLKEKRKIINIDCFILIFWISTIFTFWGNHSTYLSRASMYFLFLSIIICPIILYNNGYRRLYIFIFIILFHALYWYLTSIYANLGETNPYTSNILGI
jgi:hypothetical protein